MCVLPILLYHTAPAGLVFFFPVYPGLTNQEVMRIKQEAKHREVYMDLTYYPRLG